MVASGCCSVRACTACATHSHPAFVVSANWNGAVAASTASLICCAIVRATTHLMTSPATMPLTPPDGFCRAVNLPILTMSLMELGTAPLARSSNTTKSDCVSRGLSRRTRRCSIVIPEGPQAAPRLADLTLRLNRSLSNWKSTSGTWPRMSSGSGSRGVASLACNKRNVSGVPGANSALSNTCLADESSPK